MAMYQNITFHTVLPSYHQREGVYEMLAPWTQSTPPASAGSADAADLAQNLSATRGRLDEIFALWGQFADHYGAADAGTVRTAMNDLLGPSMALEEAGLKLVEAHEAYASAADTRGLDQVKADNDSWAPGFVTRYKQYEADAAALDRKEFREKYGHSENDEYNELHAERIPFATMAEHVSTTIHEARNAYYDAVHGIDLAELSELRFEKRDEALDVADSVEEMEEWIRQSGFFQGMDLSDEQVRRLAEQVYQSGGYDGMYVDAEGRSWARSADGRMVRAGSAMDPHLTTAVFEAMANDPEMSQLQLPTPPPEGVNPVDWTIGQVFSQGSGLWTDHINPQIPDELNRQLHSGIWTGITTVISFGLGAKGDAETRDAEMVLYPLMSSEDLDERYNRNLLITAIETGTNTAVGAGITYVSAGAAIPSGGLSIVVGIIVDEVTGAIIGYLVEQADEAQTTMDQGAVDAMADEEFPE
ncbi:MAG: hypothetical protein QJR09_02865 [Micrococcus sp.]|nr:hypothetical protein [Micrococcus sp.]